MSPNGSGAAQRSCGFPRVSGDEPLGFKLNGRDVWVFPA